MNHYAPRPDDPGFWMGATRALEPALGIHAAFLNFDTGTSSDAVQIGLGGTLSFWQDRLQFGLGYNLMSDSKDEFNQYNIKYIPTIILFYNDEEYYRVESGISLKLPDNSIKLIEDKIEEIIESKF